MSHPSVPTLFENDAILAVSKPAGVPSHSLNDETQITVESILRRTRSDLPDLKLLHRLDNGTSGVLLFAKNQAVFEQMREQFKQKTIKKFYRAWSRLPSDIVNVQTTHPFLKKLPFHLDLPLAHHPKSKKRMIAIEPDRKLKFRGKPFPAQTIIHGYEIKTDRIEFEVQILTGVTHQIRVHLAHLGFPLKGDPIYNKEFDAKDRLGLHAFKVEFDLNGVHYKIEDQ